MKTQETVFNITRDVAYCKGHREMWLDK